MFLMENKEMQDVWQAVEADLKDSDRYLVWSRLLKITLDGSARGSQVCG